MHQFDCRPRQLTVGPVPLDSSFVERDGVAPRPCGVRQRRLPKRTKTESPMSDVRLGINLWSQASDWPAFLDAAQTADRLGYDHLWTWDHVYAIFSDPIH